ncbi:MAG TPA: hypothetical protein VHQ24_05150 [Lachnospiraceae bacterium]|nr:hypothetical protein [Lachnospiraceae bacterium]
MAAVILSCSAELSTIGIEKVYIRDTKDEYRIVDVNDWITNDESLAGTFGY